VKFQFDYQNLNFENHYTLAEGKIFSVQYKNENDVQCLSYFPWFMLNLVILSVY
jgi:hypothetical protein